MKPELWKRDFLLQQRLLMRLLSAIKVRWTTYKYPHDGVTIGLTMVVPETTLEVDLHVRLEDGEELSETFSFTGTELPRRLPGDFKVRSNRTTAWGGLPVSMTAVVTFRLTPDLPEEVVVFPLIIDGRDQPNESKSNV